MAFYLKLDGIFRSHRLQESWAIAKMTTRCALWMGALKIFGSPWLRPRLRFRKFLMGFCSDWAEPINVRAKFEFCSFIRSWDNRGYPKKLGSRWMRPHSLFSEIFNQLLFGWILWMYWPNLKSVAFPVPEVLGGDQKLGQSLDTPTLPFLRNFSLAFIRMDPLNVLAKFKIRSCSRSWDNRGCPKKLGSPCIRPRSLFSKVLNGLSFGWTL